MHIFVGSTNPVKVHAVITSASETWPTVKVEAMDVPSGIAEQPRSDEETRSGAENRARSALYDGMQSLGNAYDLEEQTQILGIGLEGGVFSLGDELWSTVWATVVDPTDAVFSANGARFRIPPRIATLIMQGEEMGDVVEQLVGEADVRRKQGMIGVITNNFVDRTEEYASIAKMALGLWYGREWDITLGQIDR